MTARCLGKTQERGPKLVTIADLRRRTENALRQSIFHLAVAAEPAATVVGQVYDCAIKVARGALWVAQCQEAAA